MIRQQSSNVRFQYPADFTFSRASTGYNGKGKLFLPNQIRLENELGVGCVARVEEGTTNLVPVANQKFAGWSVHGGASVILTQNQAVPEWGATDATRIQSNGGTNTVKYYISLQSPSVAGQTYVASLHIKNIGNHPVVIHTNLSSTSIQTVDVGETTLVKIAGVGNGVNFFQIAIRALDAAHALDFIAWQPMAEVKAYATSFIETTRQPEALTMPTLATNLLTVNQASFETSVNGLGYWQSTLARVTTEFLYGSAALEITITASEGTATLSYILPPNSVGNTYTGSVYIKGIAGKQARVALRTSVGDDVYSTYVTLSGAWQRIEVSRSIDYADRTMLELHIWCKGVAGDKFYVGGCQLEPGPVATTWNLPTGDLVPRMGLPPSQGTIEGIVEITDLVKRQDGVNSIRIIRIPGVASNGIDLRHWPTNDQFQLVIWNDVGETSAVSWSDTVLPTKWYYFKIYWTISMAKIEFWDLRSQTKIVDYTITNPKLPSAFAPRMYIGSYNATINFANTRFGTHRLSNIARTADPDFNNLMPRDANTVALMDFGDIGYRGVSNLVV